MHRNYFESCCTAFLIIYQSFILHVVTEKSILNGKYLPAESVRQDNNSPSKFGFNKLDSAQFNVFQNSLRIPWQPLPSSAFIYSDVNSRIRGFDEELTTNQRVSATYKMATITPPYYPRAFGTKLDTYNYNAQFYDLFRRIPLEHQLEHLRLLDSSGMYHAGIFGSPSTVLQSLPLLNCFSRFQNCMLVNVVSLERLSYISVEQCMKRCLNYMTDIGVYCAGILYNSYIQSCDLHRTVGMTLPGRRVLMYGFDFYENCGLCNGKTTSTFVPTTEALSTMIFSFETPSTSSTKVVSTDKFTVELSTEQDTVITTPAGGTSTGIISTTSKCLSDEISVFFRSSNIQRDLKTGIISQSITEENDCRKLCLQSDNCRSYSYEISLRNCTLFTDVLFREALKESERFVYSEKVCISVDVAKKCKSPTIERMPNRFFIGVAPSVQMVTSEIQCINLCLNSLQLYKFVCLSVTYFPQEKGLNCLMSDQSRKTMPNFIQIENTTLVDYYGLDDCISKVSTERDFQVDTDDEETAEEKTDMIMFDSYTNANEPNDRFSNASVDQNSLNKSADLENHRIDYFKTLYRKMSKNFQQDNPLIKRLRKLRIKSIACWTKSPICDNYTDK